MSEAVPALNGLLSGVAQQTGIGSPDALRSLMQQITQNPAMQNTMSQLAEQIDNNCMGEMMSGLGGAQSGGFDLSRMVSSGLFGRAGPLNPSVAENSQVDLYQVTERIEQNSPPGENVVEGLSEEFMEMLCQDTRQRIQDLGN